MLALAFATPIRHCLFTGARLPAHFLLQFGVGIHPYTGKQWHLPTLAAKAAKEQKSNTTEAQYGAESDSQQEHETLSTPPGLPPRTLSRTYFLSSQRALKHMSRLAPSRQHAILPFRWKASGVIVSRCPVWREDMAEFSLKLMRMHAVQGLQRLADRTSRIYLVPCKSWEEISLRSNVAAVLWMGPIAAAEFGTQQVEGFTREERAGRDSAPPLYAMIAYKEKYVPVYNLETLLGSQAVMNLKKALPGVMNESLVVLKAKRMTVDLQMQLWKLMGYMAS